MLFRYKGSIKLSKFDHSGATSVNSSVVSCSGTHTRLSALRVNHFSLITEALHHPELNSRQTHLNTIVSRSLQVHEGVLIAGSVCVIDLERYSESSTIVIARHGSSTQTKAEESVDPILGETNHL